MKKLLLTATAIVIALANSFAQGFFEPVSFRGAFGTENWAAGWSNFTPNATAYPGDANYVGAQRNRVLVQGDITVNTTWTADNYYVLQGAVNVINNATLTIAAGTVVRGDTTAGSVAYLLIARGSKIVANGTANNPIVMTSLKPTGGRVRGDWGGVLIMGNARTNTLANAAQNLSAGERQYEALPNNTNARYGATGGNFNDNDSSGSISYVRIEYAGYAYQPNQELNSLTLGGVGRRTEMHHIMTSYGRDDSFEWFGGTVNAKYLIAFAGTDDDFDCDEGYRGNNQFVLGVRHPQVFETASNPGSNGFEHDNNTGLGGATQVVPGINDPQPATAPTFSNVTLVGPIKSGAAIDTLISGHKFTNAVTFRTNAQTGLFNAVIGGYPAASINLNHPNATISPSVHIKAQNDSLVVRNTLIVSARRTSLVTQSTPPTGVTFTGRTWFMTAGFNNDTLTSAATYANLGMINPTFGGLASGAFNSIDFTDANFSLNSGATLTTGASFNHPRLANNVASTNSKVLTSGSLKLFPNPATTEAIISFELKSAANVAINVADLAGKQVANVASTNYAAGINNVSLSTNGLNKGLYLVTVLVNGQAQTIKLSVK